MQFVIVMYHPSTLEGPSAIGVIGPYSTLTEARALVERGDIQGPERTECFITPITPDKYRESYLAFTAEGQLEAFDGSEDYPQTLEELP